MLKSNHLINIFIIIDQYSNNFTIKNYNHLLINILITYLKSYQTDNKIKSK